MDPEVNGGLPSPSASGKERMNILLSAYACEPGKGSEPGVGWRWTCGMAERVALTVLTRSNNQESIERAVKATSIHDPLRQVRFLYHDLGGIWKLLKRRRMLPTMAYYFIWQWTAARRFHREANQADIIHHLTFCTALCPGFWRSDYRTFVIGPVAAPLVNAHYLSLFGINAPAQALRNLLIRNFLLIPWLRNTFRWASAVIPANSEMHDLLVSRGIPARDVILDTGAPEGPAAKRHAGRVGAIRLMYAGQLELRKGLELALRALARACGKYGCDAVFDIFGQGPDRQRLTALAEELGIADRVNFHGAVPQAELMQNFQQADAFFFTSVRDTSGGVNLEAMAHGLPVICIAHQGVGDITDESCAERIPAGPIEETIEKITQAVIHLANDPERRTAMGEAAAKRARERFSWIEKFDRMCGHYREAREEREKRF
jgi:glycosyltransferase involved in cell wall biosynthesis